MILQKIQVTNFRSVDDSGEFDGHLDLFAHPAISAATEYERGCELVRMFG